MQQAFPLTSIEICAGAGGQALGLEQAGFEHRALVEIDPHACATLRVNRRCWRVFEQDINEFNKTRAREFAGADLVAGGVPCPPFSVAGKRLGSLDERDLFPAALNLVEIIEPRAVMLENVRGLLSPEFDDYRERIGNRLAQLGYVSDWRLLNASDFGVPQLRPRAIMVGVRADIANQFEWPGEADYISPPTVGEALIGEMRSGGWERADIWAANADSIAPTLVGGSKKHGGPDLGPSRAKRAWERLGVNGKLIGSEPPGAGFEGNPTLTVRMTAVLQGFPPEWQFCGTKTAAYRQVGNAFPPPVARAVGRRIAKALLGQTTRSPAVDVQVQRDCPVALVNVPECKIHSESGRGGRELKWAMDLR